MLWCMALPWGESSSPDITAQGDVSSGYRSLLSMSELYGNGDDVLFMGWKETSLACFFKDLVLSSWGFLTSLWRFLLGPNMLLSRFMKEVGKKGMGYQSLDVNGPRGPYVNPYYLERWR